MGMPGGPAMERHTLAFPWSSNGQRQYMANNRTLAMDVRSRNDKRYSRDTINRDHQHGVSPMPSRM